MRSVGALRTESLSAESRDNMTKRGRSRAWTYRRCVCCVGANDALALVVLFFAPFIFIPFAGPVAIGAMPNVVLIISDDQAWTDFGFMGHPAIETPCLDRLASESLVYRHGYVPSSLCRASLASIITGLYPHQHRITANDPALPRGDRFSRERAEIIKNIDRVPSLPRILGKHGFVSHQSGKWWEGNFRRGGFTHGMSHGIPERGGRHGDDGLKIGRQGMQPIYDFIDAAGEAPFFLWYAPFLPHRPHTPPDRLLEKYQRKTDSTFIAKYWASCEWFDETCGQLLDFLSKRQLTDETMIVFVVDNGWVQLPNDGGYAARSKRSPYDGGLRTPIMIRWPGRVKPRVDETPVMSTDLAPTILTACGLKATPEMSGVNLLDEKAVSARPAIFGEVFAHNAVDVHDPLSSLEYRWTVAGEWKLIVPNLDVVPDGNVELYDLGKDPHEQHDLSAEQPDRVKSMRNALDTWWPEGDTSPST